MKNENEYVYVVREFNRANEYLSIYGVYKSEEAANADLTTSIPGLEFNSRLWLWEDRANGVYYRIDAYTLQ